MQIPILEKTIVVQYQKKSCLSRTLWSLAQRRSSRVQPRASILQTELPTNRSNRGTVVGACSWIRIYAMKIAWNKNAKTKRQPVVASAKPGLPFGAEGDNDEDEKKGSEEAGTGYPGTKPPDTAHSLQHQGNKLAEEGKYHEALSKWEASLSLIPDNAIIHEQKAQVLLELGDAWRALTAATRATEVEPSWPEAWVTLGRAQLNFGEPDKAIESFDRALAIKPDYSEAKADRETASRLVRKRGQLHSSGDLNANKRRFTVGGNSEKEVK